MTVLLEGLGIGIAITLALGGPWCLFILGTALYERLTDPDLIRARKDRRS